MKKILLSGGLIVFVAALAWSATGAFFSDSETSTGNTFSAGSIDLTVDSTQHYNNAVCVGGVWVLATSSSVMVDQYPVIGSACTGTWAATDLGPTHQFFNFGDVKPGDQGENTVSLHIDSNPAWACVDIGTTANNENSLNGPEGAAGDTTPLVGELAENVSVFGWLDTASTGGAVVGDNIWQAGETVLFPATTLSALNGTTTLTLADGGTGTPLPGGSTSYIGLAWCAGTINTSVPGTVTCDGSTMTNVTQTDSATSTITFRVEQARNNAAFSCNGEVVVPNPAVTVVNNLDSLATAGWYFYDDTSDVVNNALGSFVVGPLSPFLGTGSAEMTASSSLSRSVLATSQFGGIPLSSITQLSYGEYASTTADPNLAPFVRFNVDFSNSASYQNSLVYVPSVNGTVTQNSWQQWNMASAGAKWVYSGSVWPGTTDDGMSTPKTWSEIQTEYPGIKTHATIPFIGVRVGNPGPAGLSGNVDFFTIATSGPAMTFNFGN